MRRTAMITLLLLLGLSIGTSHAVEVTLFGPEQYSRTKGKPNVYTDSFMISGLAGEGKLIIKNGEENGKHRISSALIYVNEEQILRPHDFNQQVYSLEAPVNLDEENLLSVELRSKPGSFLTIQVTQEVEAEAAAVIGPEGGGVEVTDPGSPLYGMEIFVPAGTIQQPTVFTIRIPPTVPDVPLPDEFVQDGPMISIEATTELPGPVVVDVPFSGARGEDELRLFLHFNAATQSWEAITPLPTTDPSIMKVLLPRLSTYSKGRVRIGTSYIYSGFNIDKDALAAENNRPRCIYDNGSREDRGICVGMSLVAESYFNRYAEKNGEGLRCWWTDNTSWNVACRAHGLYNGGQQGWVDGFYSLLERLGLLIGLPMDEGYLVDYLKFQLLQNRTTSINMLALEIPPEGHSILVTGWEKTGLFSGRFIVYDNQDNEQTRDLNYFRAGPLTLMDYQDVEGNDYDLFAQTSSLYLSYQLIYNLIEDTPREYPCSVRLFVPDPIGDQFGPSPDLVSMDFTFDNETGNYTIVLTTYGDPFVGDFRININLFNPDTGTTAPNPSFFNDTFNDYNLGEPTTTITLTGSNSRLLSWDVGDQVYINNWDTGSPGNPHPDGVTVFRSGVAGLPFDYPFVNEDYFNQVTSNLIGHPPHM